MANEAESTPDYQVQFMMGQIQRLQDMRKDGKVNVEVTIDHLEMLLLKIIGLELHMRRLEEAVGHALSFTSLLTFSKSMADRNNGDQEPGEAPEPNQQT